MIYCTDGKRHLICVPYSVENLHEMAQHLGIKKSWYHPSPRPHYDVPKRRTEEIRTRCVSISSTELVRIQIGISPIGRHARVKSSHHLFGQTSVPENFVGRIVWADTKTRRVTISVDLYQLSNTLDGDWDFDTVFSDIEILENKEEV